MERLSQNAPLPSMNRIAQDRRDARAEIERLAANARDWESAYKVTTALRDAEIERLRAALEAVAEGMWNPITDPSTIISEMRGTAKAALGVNQQGINNEG